MMEAIVVASVGLAVGLVESWAAQRARHAQAPTASTSAARRMRVVRTAWESSSTMSVVLEPVSGPALAFVPGQFVQLRAADLWRSYSMSSAPGGALRLTIKRVVGGKVSGALIDGVRVGDEVEVRGPFGSFGAHLPSQGEVVFVAGGSGITPFASMVHDLALRGDAARVRLLVANRSPEDAPLVEELRAVLGHRLVTHFDSVGGRLDATALHAFLAASKEPAGIWVCGPAPMMDLVDTVAARLCPGVAIQQERFAPSPTGPQVGTRRVTLVRAGLPTVVIVEPGQTLLGSSRQSPSPIPSGCEQGACGTCKVRVLSGSVEMPASTCLSSGERASGYALACVGTPSDGAILEMDP